MSMDDKQIKNVVEKYDKEYQEIMKCIKDAEEQAIKVVRDEKKMVEERYDPLEDVDLWCVKLGRKPVIPECFKVNFLAGGFTENIIVYKGIYSLYDDNI